MQVVTAAVADIGMNALNFGFGLFPVIAEFYLAAHGLLRLAQSGFVPFETVERGVKTAIGQGGKAGNAHVNADGIALMHGNFNFPLGLDRYIPLTTNLTDRDVFNLTFHRPAVAVTQPAELGQEESIIALLQFHPLWIAKAI